MLPSGERLRRDSLFQRTYAGKKSVPSPLFTLYVLPRQPRSARKMPLVGFVVGKKVHASAVKRNLAKRRLREAYKGQKKANDNLTKWYSMVWVVRSKILNANFEDICKTVAESIARADEKYGKYSGPGSNPVAQTTRGKS